MINYSDKNITESWLQNAKPWVTAVRSNEIESRSLITNKAIIDTILGKAPKTVLDIGCGEGWLARELYKSDVSTLGIDVVPELVEAASREGSGIFRLLSYEELTQYSVKEKFDVIVCNFSLLGHKSVIKIFKTIPYMLNDHGYFIIQTIHPIAGCGDFKYEDGWRKGSWGGFSDNFTNPPPWYFRTLETWKALFQFNGFELSEIFEPLNPKTKNPASVIFVGELSANNALYRTIR